MISNLIKWGAVDDCNIKLPIVKSLVVKDVNKNFVKVCCVMCK